MLTAQPAREHEPLTHQACVVAARRDGGIGSKPLKPWVQVRRFDRRGAYVLCGLLVELGSYNLELFRVETAVGAFWVDGRNIRMCTTDGRCTCAEAGNV